MRVTLNDGRQMTGQMLAFDKVRCLFALYNMESQTDLLSPFYST